LRVTAADPACWKAHAAWAFFNSDASTRDHVFVYVTRSFSWTQPQKSNREISDRRATDGDSSFDAAADLGIYIGRLAQCSRLIQGLQNF
jgi:hypothetical protein